MKSIEYYLSLEYPIELRKIPDNLGGGWTAFISLLGRDAVVGDGETPDEAVKSMVSAKEFYFRHCIEKGIEIPEPPDEKIDLFSGRFVVRIPKELHRELAKRAKENESSLNQYVTFILSSSIGGSLRANWASSMADLKGRLETLNENLSRHVKENVSWTIKDWRAFDEPLVVREGLHIYLRKLSEGTDPLLWQPQVKVSKRGEDDEEKRERHVKAKGG